MKVILQEDVKDLGKVGEVVKVATGYARNFLFPRKLALAATEDRVKEWKHLQKVAEVKKQKAMTDRKGIVERISGMTLTFKLAAGEGDKLFGSVTAHDISKEFENQNFSIDKKDIKLEVPIKVLGEHRAVVSLGTDLAAEITIAVERAE